VTVSWKWFTKARAAGVDGSSAAADRKILHGDKRWRLPALARFGAELRRVEDVGRGHASGGLDHLVGCGDGGEVDPCQQATGDVQ
jgi:hypothetical protein